MTRCSAFFWKGSRNRTVRQAFAAGRQAIFISVTLWLAGLTARGELFPARQSQQFTVVDGRSVYARSPGTLRSRTGEPLIRLDADVLLLSAERIRADLWRETKFPAGERTKIRLVLYLASKPDDLIGFVSNLTPRGWEYEMNIPDQVEREKLVRGIVGVLLLEVANHGQGPKSAELPLWLTEGFTRQLIEKASQDLVVGAVPMQSMLRVVRETPAGLPGTKPQSSLDHLRTARAVLSANRPLSFDELARPRAEQLTGSALGTFQLSAQLFLDGLLKSPDGSRKLYIFLRDLPRCWNWETALLDGFSEDFRSMLEVEKRWSVDVLAFTSSNPGQVLSQLSCLEKLDEALRVPAQIRLTADTLPQRKALNLQQVINNWEFPAQAGVLQAKVSTLAVLRLSATGPVGPIIDGYQKTLATYLYKRSQANRAPESRMQPMFNGPLAVQDALRDLDQLDQQRKALKPEQVLSVNSPTTP